MRDPKLLGPVAMVTGQYPAVSMTFVDREVRALRTMGYELLTFTQQSPLEAGLQGVFQNAEAKTVFRLRQRLKQPAEMSRAIAFACQRPGGLLRTLRLAFHAAPPGMRGHAKQFVYFLEALVLARAVTKRNVRHIHNHLGDASGTVAMLAAELAGVPFSMTLHGPEIFWDRSYWALGRKIAKSKFTVCISAYALAQAQLVTETDDREKLHIVRCGLELETYGARQADAQKAPLLFVGRLDYRKGLHIALQAFEPVSLTNENLRLVVVGDGEERENLWRLTERLRLEDKVHFRGALTEAEISAELSNAAALLVPSLSEGLPTVILEAMASSVPVIATSVAGIAEAVRNGETGLLVQPCNSDQFARAILGVLDDMKTAQIMGQNGRRLIEAEYDVKRTSAQLAALITTASVCRGVN